MIHQYAFLIVAIVSSFGFIPAIIWVIFSYVRRVKVARMQAEVHSKLIDKIGSSPEFLTYLDTEAGKRLVASLGMEQTRHEPYSGILGSVQRGVILLLLGIALLALGKQFAGAEEGFLISGGLAIALGAGFLISAGISYPLSKKFGLFDRGLSNSPTSDDPHSQILRSIRHGMILACLGIGLLIIGIWNGFSAFLGGLLLALGAGFLISAGISYRLSQKFGLFERDRAAEKPVS
jgi:hypothetical protein